MYLPLHQQFERQRSRYALTHIRFRPDSEKLAKKFTKFTYSTILNII